MDKEFIDIYNIISNEPYNEKNENKFNKERQINKETKIDKAWKYYYDLAKKYYEFHGNVNMSLDFKTKNGYEYDEYGVKLGIWLYEQFIAYRENDFSKVTMEQIKLLEKLNLNLKNIKYVAWLKNYNLAESYYKHHGNSKIPQNFKTKNGYEYDEFGINLGAWIRTQRAAYRGYGHLKITDCQINLLDQLEMIYNIRCNDTWKKYYILAKAYYEYHRNLNIPIKFKTTNGYEYDEQGIKLGKWMSNQRQAYKGQGNYKLTEQQIKLLEKIEIKWFDNNIDKKLQNEIINEQNKKKKKIEILNRLKSYLNTLDENSVYSKEELNSGFIKKLKTDKEFIGIYNKVSNEKYNTETKNDLTFNDKIKISEEGKKGETNFEKWMKKYKLAESYYEHYGNLEIPIKFKTTNGYEYDEEGINLGSWINTQRKTYKGQGDCKLTEEQKKLLEKIGMVPDVNSDNWMKKYKLAESYYKRHGNSEIPRNFKTINGYEYDEEGIKLGIWISTQRKAYKGQGTHKLTEQQIKLLEKIETKWFDNNIDKKLQNEIINEQNKKKKKIEILNRVKFYLNTLDENKVYSKEEINSGFVKKLNK